MLFLSTFISSRYCKTGVFYHCSVGQKYRYLAEEDVSKVILNKILVHTREVFALATEHRVSAMICIHNHPSGEPEPSKEDLWITQRLFEVGKLVGIPVLDYVIVSHDSYKSFADKGIL